MALASLIFADNTYETTLYEKIFPLMIQKKSIKVYTADKNKHIFVNSKSIVLTNDCDSADIVYGKINGGKCLRKPHFAITYKDFVKDKNAIGAFYWRKGRPQLRFSIKAFKRFHLVLPKILEKYAQ